MSTDDVLTSTEAQRAGAPDLPPEVLLRGVRGAGPLPWRGTAGTRVSPLTLALREWQGEIVAVSAGPLRDEDGVEQGARLTCALVKTRQGKGPADGDTGQDGGRPLALHIQITGALSPGLHRGELRLSGPGWTHSLLVRVRIDAWWPWMLGAILLGLIAFGVFNFFAQQQALGEQRAQVFSLREELQGLQGRAFDGTRWVGLGTEAGEALTAALGVLNAPRPLGVRDGRRERADALIRVAQGRIEALRADLKEVEPGEAAVQALRGRWKHAQERLGAVEARLIPMPSPADAASDGLSAALDRLDQAQAEALIRPLTAAIEASLGAQVERVLLTYAGGAGAAAGHLAERVDQWLRRAMALLAERVDVVLAWRVLGQDVRAREALVREQLRDPGLDPATASALRTELDQAMAAFIARPDPEGMQGLHRVLGTVQTRLLQERAAALIARYTQAAGRTEAEADLGPMDALFAGATPADTREQRQALLGQVLDLWQGLAERLAQGEAPGSHPVAMLAKVADLRGLVAAWDQEALSAGVRELLDHRSAYLDERQAALARVSFDGFCTEERIALGQDLALSALSLGLLEPRPEVAGLEPVLDRMRLRLERLPSGQACLDALVKLHGEALDLGNQLFTTILKYARAPLEQRLAAAQASGQGVAIALAEQLMRDPWPLVVNPETPPEGRTTDREIRLRIGGLDPAWGPGVRVRVTFGDGAEWITDAEALRQAGVLPHRYLTAGTYRVQVRADLGPEVSQGEAALGEGGMDLEVAASPVGTARALAASFFNLRFALALLVALLINGWRLSAKGPFGARPLDYVEAFAIGAGSNLGLEGVQTLFTGK